VLWIGRGRELRVAFVLVGKGFCFQIQYSKDALAQNRVPMAVSVDRLDFRLAGDSRSSKEMFGIYSLGGVDLSRHLGQIEAQIRRIRQPSPPLVT
jgi:hypothetical protein